MPLISLMLASLLQLATPINQATEDNNSLILWENLRHGMPKSEVQVLYPTYRATILNQCPVQVLSTYTKAKLRAVILVSTAKSQPCAEIVKRSLEEKYGYMPKIEHYNQQTLTIATSTSVSTGWIGREDRIWDVGGLRIILSTFPGVHSGYNVVYSIAPGSSAQTSR